MSNYTTPKQAQNLYGEYLQGMSMRGAHLSDASLYGVDPSDADLRGAIDDAIESHKK